MTGAARDDFLLEDIQYFAKKTGKPITVANLKLENCAGVNKMLSHAHSIVMTRDYVDLMQKYLDASVMDVEESYIYYVGRNAFNIVFPHASPEQAEELLSERFDAYIDRQINQKPIIEYFEKNGMPVPPEITNESILMGDIPNLRGLGNGIRTINLLTTAFDASVTNKDLTSFHRKAIGNDQSIIDQFNMNTLDLISPEIFNEEQIPAITALYKKAVGGLKNDQ